MLRIALRFLCCIALPSSHCLPSPRLLLQVSSLCMMCPAGARGERLSKLAEDVLLHGSVERAHASANDLASRHILILALDLSCFSSHCSKPNPLLVDSNKAMRSLMRHIFYKVRCCLAQIGASLQLL